MKWCPGCKADLPSEQFHKNRRAKDGLNRICRRCNYLASKTWKSAHPERRHASYRRNALQYWNRNLLRNYGIGAADYVDMFREQQGLCICCYEPSLNTERPDLVVDHNHNTGKVRGLICGNCNLAIGHLKDDPNKASLVADYLRTNHEHSINC